MTKAIYEYAQENSLLHSGWAQDPNWCWESREFRHISGAAASDSEMENFDEVQGAMEQFLKHAEKVAKIQSGQVTAYSLGAFLDEEFARWCSRQVKDDGRQCSLQMMFEFKKRELMASCGCSDLNAVSLHGYLQGRDLPGEECIPIACGYSSIVSSLPSEIPKEWVMYNSPVSLLRCLSDRVEIGLECGKVFCAKAVVITVSLGVLEAGHISFEPPLPDWKIDAIHSAGFGQIEKCLLCFEELAWQKIPRQGVHLGWPAQGVRFCEDALRNWEPGQSWLQVPTTVIIKEGVQTNPIGPRAGLSVLSLRCA